jgi:hypothetical protein
MANNEARFEAMLKGMVIGALASLPLNFLPGQGKFIGAIAIPIGILLGALFGYLKATTSEDQEKASRHVPEESVDNTGSMSIIAPRVEGTLRGFFWGAVFSLPLCLFEGKGKWYAILGIPISIVLGGIYGCLNPRTR